GEARYFKGWTGKPGSWVSGIRLLLPGTGQILPGQHMAGWWMRRRSTGCWRRWELAPEKTGIRIPGKRWGSIRTDTAVFLPAWRQEARTLRTGLSGLRRRLRLPW